MSSGFAPLKAMPEHREHQRQNFTAELPAKAGKRNEQIITGHGPDKKRTGHRQVMKRKVLVGCAPLSPPNRSMPRLWFEKA
jgi:hypothetical protein